MRRLQACRAVSIVDRPRPDQAGKRTLADHVDTKVVADDTLLKQRGSDVSEALQHRGVQLLHDAAHAAHRFVNHTAVAGEKTANLRQVVRDYRIRYEEPACPQKSRLIELGMVRRLGRGPVDDHRVSVLRPNMHQLMNQPGPRCAFLRLGAGSEFVIVAVVIGPQIGGRYSVETIRMPLAAELVRKLWAGREANAGLADCGMVYECDIGPQLPQPVMDRSEGGILEQTPQQYHATLSPRRKSISARRITTSRRSGTARTAASSGLPASLAV